MKEKLDKGQTIARSNPHVQTLQRAAKQGVKTVQEFIKNVDLESNLH